MDRDNGALKQEIERLEKQLAACRSSTGAGPSLSPEVTAAVTAMPMVIWAVDLEGTITLSEGRGLSALGLSSGELVGQSVFEVYRDSPKALAPIRAALKGQLGYSKVEVGGAFWEIRYFPRWDGTQLVGVIGLSVDVTEQHKADQALTQSEERWRSLSEHAPDRIWIVDRTHRLVFANREVIEPSGQGRSREDLLGSCIFDLFDAEYRPAATTVLEQVWAGHGTGSYECSVTTPDDPSRWYENRVSPILDGSQVSAVLVVGTDVTDKRRIEVEKSLLHSQVEHAQKLESLGALAGGIAHDFNNLLMGVVGHAELAKLDIPESSPATAQLEGILTACRRATELCQQMLDYAGKGRFRLGEVNLSELLRGMTEQLRATAGEHLQLTTELCGELWSIRGDAEQLQQVAIHLVRNAADATRGSGKVTIRTGCQSYEQGDLELLRMRTQLEPGQYVYMEVADTGCGMPEATVNRMFDPFFSTKVTGRGLGMASVLGIVQGHNGGLCVDSTPSRGTTIRVLLPRPRSTATSTVPPAPDEPGQLTPDPAPVGALNPSTDDEAPPASAAKAASGSADSASFGDNRTIMVVDDELRVRSVASQMLHRLGFRTIDAEHGADAIARYKSHRGPIAAILLDLTMPVMGGWEAQRSLLALDPSARILLSTGYDVGGEIAPEVAASLLRKPYTLPKLQAALRDILS